MVARAFTIEAIRAAEAPLLASLPEGTLMDRAAARLAVECVRILEERFPRVYGRRLVLLVGAGNNGGDALLAGAILRRRGAHVVAVTTGGAAHARGLRLFTQAGGRTADADAPSAIEALQSADLVVDGIVGIGGKPGLSAPWDSLVAALPAGVAVVAVDMPSGVDPDTGQVTGLAVQADMTVSFGALKPCLLLPPGSHLAGRIVDVSVGIEDGLPARAAVERLTAADVARLWPVPEHAGHKYSRGVLGVVAGSDTYPGAAVLAVLGAQRAGVGIVRFLGPPMVTDHVLRAVPEAVPGEGRVQAWLLGSGVEADEGQDRAIEGALASGLPCVIDAGALTECVRQRSAGRREAPADSVLLTPHAGELSRVLAQLGQDVPRSEVEARPARYAMLVAQMIDATVLLKGPTTLVASPDGRMRSQNDAPQWLATAGAGDVLAGIAGALMAQGLGACDAGAVAASVHGRAASRLSGGGPISASGVAAATPETIADLLRTHRRS